MEYPVTGAINCPTIGLVRFVDAFIGLITVEPAATTPKNLGIDNSSILTKEPLLSTILMFAAPNESTLPSE